MKRTLCLLLTIALLQSCKEAPKPDVVDETIKKVETSLVPPVYIEGDDTWTLEERMAHYGVPGVSIAVINDGEIHWTKTYGVVDKVSKVPVTKETLFQAGSISKPVAAYGALKLVEQDQLDLDSDINTFLKSWKLPENEFTKEKKVALKHLLSHTGGLTVHGFLGYSPDLPVPTLEQVLNGIPPANSGAILVDKVPEESFRYSGGGYTIMQQMMIDVSGKSFPSLMDELVLQPLGMNHSTYDQPLESPQLEKAATGYLPDGSMTKGKRHTYPEMAAAGLWTTSEDLAKFAVDLQKTLKGSSTKVLSQNMGTNMLTPFVEDFIGLGIFINKKKDAVYFGHGGWDEGFSSDLVAHKNKGYGVVVLTNSNHPEFISELIRSVALTYEWEDYVPTYGRIAMDTVALSTISGRYRVDGNWLVEVFQKEGVLYGKEVGGKASELVQVSDSTYARRENDRLIQFKPNPETNGLDMLVRNPNTGKVQTTFTQLKQNEKLPIEWLVAGDFEQALVAYQALVKADPTDPTILEGNLNGLGYRFLYGDNMKLAQDVFKVNTRLYPESSNVYDSYAEACMQLGETDLAIENYKKSLSLDPENKNAEEKIAELEKLKTS
ncbi:serine hydrolase [Flavobacteriaceae bacterium TP-CH-4]|uniref:Serine hydrolase n=1 Tax=Pelagihabitans pacificus TaxID=2696054 RepID=A0A967AVJ1_9FLAO|nr:serine hydrolase [Pelagihabitans pacificus]NHF61169.1 serine hydrolase [Pelagihabitans pacificus]